MEGPVEMQRFKYIIVSSAVALALTAANLSAQQSPSRPGGTGGGGGGDASASNQASQISLETQIATSAVAIATHANTSKEFLSRVASSTTSMISLLDGLEGLVTSGNALLAPIATSTVGIATGTNAGFEQWLRTATSAVAIATGANASRELLANIATHAFQIKDVHLRIATSAVGIATGIHAMAQVQSAIATSVVKMAAAGVGTDTELPAASTPANGTTTPSTPGVYSYNMIYRSDQGRWFYGEAASSSTGVADAGTGRVVEASNSPVATAAVETALRQPVIATSVVAISDRFPDRVIGCTNQAVIATTATNYRQVVAAGTGQIIYICSELWTVTQAALVTFGYGGGTNCDSGPVDLTGEMSVAASSGAARGSGLGMLYQIPAGKAFCVRIATASGGAAIGGTVGYVRR